MQKSTYLVAALAVTAAIAAQPKNNLEPDAGSWHTWIVPDVKAYRAAAPPNRGASEQEAKDLEVLATKRDATVLAGVQFWNAGSAPYRWIQFAQQEVNGHGPGRPPATRALPLAAAGLSD